MRLGMRLLSLSAFRNVRIRTLSLHFPLPSPQFGFETPPPPYPPECVTPNPSPLPSPGLAPPYSAQVKNIYKIETNQRRLLLDSLKELLLQWNGVQSITCAKICILSADFFKSLKFSQIKCA
jgi:hypothetical protein